MNFPKHERKIEIPFYVRPIVWLLDKLPAPNSIWGIVSYTLLFYLVALVIYFFYLKFFQKIEDETNSDMKDFNKRLKAYREVKDRAARKMLKKTN